MDVNMEVDDDDKNVQMSDDTDDSSDADDSDQSDSEEDEVDDAETQKRIATLQKAVLYSTGIIAHATSG